MTAGSAAASLTSIASRVGGELYWSRWTSTTSVERGALEPALYDLRAAVHAGLRAAE
jgi:hypothetical protein